MPYGIPNPLKRCPEPSMEGFRRAEFFVKESIQRLDELILWFLPFVGGHNYALLIMRIVVVLLIIRVSSFLYLFGRAKSLSTYSDRRIGRFTPGQHLWVHNKDSVLLRGFDPRYCSICRGVAHGFSDGAVQCSICACRAHTKCLGRGGFTILPCKAVQRNQLGELLPISTSQDVKMITPHQWFRSNIKIGSPCACCGNDFRAGRIGLQGYRCPWCNAEVHESCLRKASQSFCTLGRHCKIILPPVAVVERARGAPARGRLKAALRSVLPHPEETFSDQVVKTDRSPAQDGSSSTSWIIRATDSNYRRSSSKSQQMRGRVRIRDIILDIDPDAIPSDVTPLAILVNTRSGAGARMGKELLCTLRAHLNPLQVADLSTEDPIEFLRRFSNVPRLRILCCGGDGTVGWILHAIDSVHWKNGPPPLAVLPMGTGNDLARVLGWGSGYDGTADLDNFLDMVSESREVMVDRWSVDMVPLKTKGKGARRVPMGNYMGIGVDGQVALEFHRMREAHSKLFFSRVVNKIIYACTGFRNILFPSCQNLRNFLELYCDGQLIPLPELTESVIILNINSYAGGSRLWTPDQSNRDENSPTGDRTWVFGTPKITQGNIKGLKYPPICDPGDFNSEVGSSSDGASDDSWSQNESPLSEVRDRYRPSRMNDGLLEVVAVTGVLHLGIIQVGIGAGHAVAQGRELRVRTLRALPMQVDGEPWRQPPSDIVIQQHPQALMLRPATPEEGRVRDMVGFHECVASNAWKKGVISLEQCRKLSNEARLLASESRRGYGNLIG